LGGGHIVTTEFYNLSHTFNLPFNFKKKFQPIISKKATLNSRTLSIIINSRRLKHFLHFKFILQLWISRDYQNMHSTFLLPIYRILIIKVEQSRYRPGVAQGVPGS
jgi:hypothetical protein